LVTGAAGFIGFHLCRRLVADGKEVVGMDNLNDYYDPRLKLARLRELGFDVIDLDGGPRDVNFVGVKSQIPNPKSQIPMVFFKLDLADRRGMERLFAEQRFDVVVNLAAQAGVRYSLKNPHAYVDSNLVGFMNVLEGCRHTRVGHLVFASSSSVYGANTRMPFSVHHNVDHPVSLYAATKKANELMAHTYASLYAVPCTGLRFFTVYGPWGRPDMALFSFTKAIIEGRPIDVFNEGRMRRDFTYIDDIVEGVVRVIDKIPGPDGSWTGERPDSATSFAPYRLYNIGNNNPVELTEFIEAIEAAVGKKAVKNLLPLQPGDVEATWADVDDLRAAVGFAPATPLREGVRRFVDWYRQHITQFRIWDLGFRISGPQILNPNF
jgi:UDP-glucuronate 4-epimerase